MRRAEANRPMQQSWSLHPRDTLSGTPARFATRASVALLLVLALFAIGARSAFAAEAQVIIVQPSDQMAWRYEPANLKVSVGTTVTWINEGATAVTVTSSDGLFDSEQIQPGGSFSVTFDAPGTFRYFCVPYPHMKGTIVVTSNN